MIVYHLSSGGQANTVTGDGLLAAASGGEQPPDACYHDPFSPVPAGDRAILDLREDVLCYTGPVLAGPAVPFGPARLRLCLSSSAARAHLAAAILDVPAAGPATVLGEGAAHVSGLSRREAHIVAVSVPLGAAVLEAGHRLRLELYRGRCARCTDADTPAVDRVYHDDRQPSTLVIPVAPPAVAGTRDQMTASRSS
jgi:predicted acyl esterase